MRRFGSFVVFAVTSFAAASGRVPSACAHGSSAEAQKAARGDEMSGETAAIAKLRDEWAADLHGKRLEAIAMLYAPDAAFLQPTGERIAGRDAIRELCRKIMGIFTSDVRLQSAALELSGNLAYDTGEFRETLISVADGSKIESAGSYLMVFRRQANDGWLILEQVWTGAEPAEHEQAVPSEANSHSNGRLATAPRPRTPDLEAQRTAMKRLGFLVGNWAGEALMQSGPGEPVELSQTEQAQYKLNGLLLMIEGVGRTKSGGQPALQALGLISYDDESKAYRMRAFNDGRFLETEMKLLDGIQGLTWAFALGEIKTNSILRINEKGEWTEFHEITIGAQPPKKLMEVVVRPQK
jgi:uncharacterized protein (TIGR02246 family)